MKLNALRSISIVVLAAIVASGRSNSLRSQDVEPSSEKGSEPKAEDRPYQISKETTYITEPLDSSGAVDYVAFINALNSRSAKPEGNASVLMLQAMGPSVWPEDMTEPMREEYLRWLGLDSFPAAETYFIPFDLYVQGTDGPIDSRKAQLSKDDFGRSTENPWRDEDFPQLAEWLIHISGPLETIVEASKRPTRFEPLILRQPGEMLNGAFVMPNVYRVAGRTLACRSMNRIAMGDHDGACDDIIATFRLGRLMGVHNAHGLTESLVGGAIEGYANIACKAFLESAGTTPHRLQRLVEGFESLPDQVPIGDVVGRFERFAALAFVQKLVDQAQQGVREFKGIQLPDAIVRLQSRNTASLYDWDRILRRMNDRYDGFETAVRNPSFRDGMEMLGEQWGKFETELEDRDSYWKLFLLAADQGIDVVQSDAIELIVMSTFYPALGQVQRAMTRFESKRRLAVVACQLELYAISTGRYPVDLNELAAHAGVILPLDPYINEPLRYRQTEIGFLLYSVSANCRDDGGKTWRNPDGTGDPNANDLDFEVRKTDR